MPHIVTQAQIAARAGVSQAAVSCALRGQPNIPAETRERVQRAARELGYQPNPLLAAHMAHLRALRKPEYRATLGFLVQQATARSDDAELISRYWKGCMQRAAEIGYRVEQFRIDTENMSGSRLSRILVSRGINGVIVAPLVRPDKPVELEWELFAAVALGYGLSSIPTDGVAAAPMLLYLPPRPRRYRPKIALIGCGGISEYHLRAYVAMGLDVVALCDRHAPRAEKRRAEFFPAARVFTDHRDVLARDEVEVVDIALHPADRITVIEAALLARKHVLSQKPFVLDLDVGERLVALADAHGVKLAVNQNGRWAPHFSYLAAAVDAGLVGEIASIDCTLQWNHTWTTGTAFEDIHHLVLFDFGIHWFDMVTRLLRGRRAQNVWASVARTHTQKMKPPILAHVVIDYDGAQVRLNFNGHVHFGQEDRTVVCGSKGTLRSFGPSLSEQTVTLHTAVGRASMALEGTWFTHGFQGAMGELLCAIEENREPSNSARENLDSLALCFSALASADAGKHYITGTVRAASK